MRDRRYCLSKNSQVDLQALNPYMRSSSAFVSVQGLVLCVRAPEALPVAPVVCLSA